MNIFKSPIAPFAAVGLVALIAYLASKSVGANDTDPGEDDVEPLIPLFEIGDILYRKSFLDDEDMDRILYHALEIVEVDTGAQIYRVVYVRLDPDDQDVGNRTFEYLHTNYVNSDDVVSW